VNCPRCGLLNLATADVCVHCKTRLEEFPGAEKAKNRIIDLTEANSEAATVKGKAFLAGSAPPPKIPYSRTQLDLKLDRLKERHGAIPSESTEKLLSEIRNREFAKPSKRQPHEVQNDLFPPSPPVYHPLAQKALDKLNRLSRVETNIPQAPAVEALQPLQSVDASAESTVHIRRAKRGSASKLEKVERIEINLNQGALPFDEAENSGPGIEEGLRKGLVAASLPLRIRAGAIDALFICGCFLIFLMIVFFVPDFVFLSRSSFLGLAVAAVFIANSYIFLLTALSARTLGMDHEHLEVISFDGKFPTLRESSLRSFGYFISLGCFCLGFLWGVFDPQKLTWHDRISKTLIVSKGGQT
jgi:uncharacterized RDD family membrane protein YckC